MTFEPIDQAEIDAIIAKYDEEVAQHPDIEAALRVKQQAEVQAAIFYQRQKAMAAGGELAERIWAENQNITRALGAADPIITPESIERARQRDLQIKAMMAEHMAQNGDWKCDCGTINSSKFCRECGAKRPENN